MMFKIKCLKKNNPESYIGKIFHFNNVNKMYKIASYNEETAIFHLGGGYSIFVNIFFKDLIAGRLKIVENVSV